MVWYGQPQTQEAGIHKTWSYDKLHILAGKRECGIHNYVRMGVRVMKEWFRK